MAENLARRLVLEWARAWVRDKGDVASFMRESVSQLLADALLDYMVEKTSITEQKDAVEEQLTDVINVPPVPDRLRMAPMLVFAMTLYSRNSETPSREDIQEEMTLGPRVIRGSKEGMKELVCGWIEDLWWITRP